MQVGTLHRPRSPSLQQVAFIIQLMFVVVSTPVCRPAHRRRYLVLSRSHVDARPPSSQSRETPYLLLACLHADARLPSPITRDISTRPLLSSRHRPFTVLPIVGGISSSLVLTSTPIHRPINCAGTSSRHGLSSRWCTPTAPPIARGISSSFVLPSTTSFC